MSPRQILLSTALIFLLAGIIFGLSPRNIEGGYGDSTSCGSIFIREDLPEDFTDFATGNDINEDCDSKLSGMKPFMLGAFGLSGVAFIAAFVASGTPVRAEQR